MKIHNARSVKTHNIKAVVYGPSGNGKTSLAATLGKEYRPLVIDIEGGTLSLHGKDVDILSVSRADDGSLISIADRPARLREVYQFLQKPETKEKYKTVFIDSITELGQTVHHAVSKEYPEAKDTLRLWGAYGVAMRDTVRAFRDLPDYHVVFTCLSKIAKDDSGKRYAEFELQGSISDKLPGFMDLVMYLRVVEDGARELVCQPTDAIPAKDRSARLNKIEPADLGSVFKKILT